MKVSVNDSDVLSMYDKELQRANAEIDKEKLKVYKKWLEALLEMLNDEKLRQIFGLLENEKYSSQKFC